MPYYVIGFSPDSDQKKQDRITPINQLPLLPFGPGGIQGIWLRSLAEGKGSTNCTFHQGRIRFYFYFPLNC